MGATAVSGFVAPGAFVRRVRDGMLGRTGVRSSIQRSAGWLQRTQEITWLGQWGIEEWDPSRRNALRIELLDGAEASEASARFTALTCPACAGTGLLDPRRPRYDNNKCPAPDCVLGRRLGVEPAFDTSYAEYRAWLDGERAREEAYARQGAARTAVMGAWADATLVYAGNCVECGARLAAGTAAQRRKVGNWEVRCAHHAGAGV